MTTPNSALNLSRIGTLDIAAPMPPEYAAILTPEALDFVATLQREFGARREELLRARAVRQAEFDAGKLLRLPERDAPHS